MCTDFRKNKFNPSICKKHSHLKPLMKREYQETSLVQIDIFFLLNHRKFITKEEFTNILPRVSYKSYTEGFLRKNVNKFFKDCHESCWFVTRYLQVTEDNRKYLERFTNFTKNGPKTLNQHIGGSNQKCLLIKTVPNTMTEQEFEEFVKKTLYFKKHTMIQLGEKRSYEQSCIVSLEDGAETEDSKNFLLSLMTSETKSDIKAYDFTEVRIRESNFETKSLLQEIIKLFYSFCARRNIYKPEDFEVFSSNFESFNFDGHDKFTYFAQALREVFLFCVFCGKSYDSVEEMLVFCGDHHIISDEEEVDSDYNEVFRRKLLLYNSMPSLDFLVTKTVDSELDKYILKKEKDKYKCDCCIKMFATVDFTKVHLKKKHPNVLEEVTARIENFNLMINNIDAFMIAGLFGIDDNYYPEFIKNSEKTPGVRYSTKVYSGEISINKL